ncbi:MAG: DUF1588 domain-containing protein, partial [Bdellovibrionales bacterium]|nr:DUF1588 domain-containing protein [Bdellovibrionales bacterium]
SGSQVETKRYNFDSCTNSSGLDSNKIYILGPSEYLNIAEDLFSGVDHSSLALLLNGLPFVPDTFDGNLEFKDDLNFVTNREPIIAYFSNKLLDFVRSTCESLNTDCRKEILNSNISNIYRREVSGVEIQEILNATADLSFDSFIQFIFYHPDFHLKIYPNELTPDAFVAKVAMTLFGSFPPPELKAKRMEVFNDPDKLKIELLKLLKDPKNVRRFSRRFWSKWLPVDRLASIALPANSDFDKLKALDDFFSIIEDGIVSGKNLKNLFFEGYEVEGLPKSLISHPSFALATSRVVNGELKTHYVQRGINIASKLLCLGLPPLDPATMEELEEAKADSVGLSFAEAIEQHRRNPNCSSCHSIIDPIGVTMEHLGPFGEYRDKFIDGSPIFSQGEFLNKPYSNFSSLVEIIADSGELRSCFLEQFEGLANVPESAQFGTCDAREIFSADEDLPVIDIITQMLVSPRFLKKSILPEEVKLKFLSGIVGDMYQIGLGRQASIEEVEHWSLQYRKRGLQFVVKGVLLSAEMNSLNLTPQEYVRRAFKILAGYSLGEQNLDNQVQQYNSLGRELYLEGLLSEDEIKKRISILE